MRCSLLLFILALPTTLSLGGCASAAHREQLEARLREQEDRLARYEQRIEELEAAATPSSLPPRNTNVGSASDEITLVAAERPATASPVQSIAFSPLVTGGRDEDTTPGHDVIHALIQPLDRDGDLIKTRGGLTLELLDMAAVETDRTAGVWTFTAEQTKALWQRGLMGSGFRVRLTPQSGPFPEDALLIVHFETADGRQLDAARALKLKPQHNLSAATTASTTDGSSSFEQIPSEIPIRESRPIDTEPRNPFFEFLPDTSTDDEPKPPADDLQTRTLRTSDLQGE